MNPEERSLLERTYKLAEENNTILRSIRRSTRIGNVIKFIYWAIILGLSFGAYYFIQPYVQFMMGALGGGTKSDTAQSKNPSEYINTLQDLLK